VRVEEVVVPGWPRPRGYANGMVGTGRALHVAGQLGWEPDGTWVAIALVEQFGRALDNVLAVVRAAGGEATNIAELTAYVVDVDAYRRDIRALGPMWKARMGAHYPAMALVAVTALVEPRALIEIQAVAYL